MRPSRLLTRASLGLLLLAAVGCRSEQGGLHVEISGPLKLGEDFDRLEVRVERGAAGGELLTTQVLEGTEAKPLPVSFNFLSGASTPPGSNLFVTATASLAGTMVASAAGSGALGFPEAETLTLVLAASRPTDGGIDAGEWDGGELDAGAEDAGEADAGEDAGEVDAGQQDAGNQDAGSLDAGFGAPDGGLGSGCISANECASGNCIDGVCCDSPCGNPCDSCNVPGNLGTCRAALDGYAGSPSCSPYTCDGTATDCASQCLSDADCDPAYYCHPNRTCRAKKANGVACGGSSECVSGYCVDGVCCDGPCTGSCNACNLAGSSGTCTQQPAGAAGSPSCAPYACPGNSASCGASCTSNAQCASSAYCSGTTCVPKLAPGASCTAASECASNFCVDGVCCNLACAGGCDACNLSGYVGTCRVLSTGATGAPSCAPYVCNGTGGNCPVSCTSDSNCATGSYCSANTCAAKKSNASACGANNECASGYCVEGYCCDGSCSGQCDSCALSGKLGTCSLRSSSAAGSPACAPYLCSGTSAACGSTCSSDAQCASSAYCSGTSCVTKKSNGVACVDPRECASGYCADGVCCGGACTGACDSCNQGGYVGTCRVSSAGSTGSPSCSPYACDGLSASCPTSCGGTGSCPIGQTCSSMGTCIGKLATFKDDFNDNALSSQWIAQANGGTILEQNQQLEISSVAGQGGVNALWSQGVYDGVSSELVVELKSAGNQALSSFMAAIVILDNMTLDYLRLEVSGGQLEASLGNGGLPLQLANAPYNASAMRYLRLREAGSLFYFDYSADDLSWTNLYTLVTPFSVSEVSVALVGGASGSESSASTVIFDNVNP